MFPRDGISLASTLLEQSTSQLQETSFPENLPEEQNGFPHSLTHKHFKHSCAKLLILFKCCPEKEGQEGGKEREEGQRELSQAGWLPTGKHSKLYPQPIHHPGNIHYICKRNKNILLIISKSCTRLNFRPIPYPLCLLGELIYSLCQNLFSILYSIVKNYTQNYQKYRSCQIRHKPKLKLTVQWQLWPLVHTN